jgi:hypothetical protein
MRAGDHQAVPVRHLASEGRILADGPAADVVGAFVDHAIPPQPQSALGGAGRA